MKPATRASKSSRSPTSAEVRQQHPSGCPEQKEAEPTYIRVPGPVVLRLGDRGDLPHLSRQICGQLGLAASLQLRPVVLGTAVLGHGAEIEQRSLCPGAPRLPT